MFCFRHIFFQEGRKVAAEVHTRGFGMWAFIEGEDEGTGGFRQ